MKDPNQERLDGEMTQRPDGRSMRTCPGCGFHVDQSVTICPRDGTHLAAPVSQDPAFMGKYEFIETIGSGGMGVIYKARHVVLNKVVAIKMVHAHLLNDEIMR
ncbi:MAG TPA: hypothetical protein V6C72_03590, partial [Chroococcales cyanobacterium]